MPLISATVLCFTGAVAAYLVAAVLALVYVRTQGETSLRGANRAMAGGSALLVAVFILRAVTWGSVPLTSPVESMNLFLLLSTAVIGLVMSDSAMRPLQVYYAPTLAVFAVIAIVVSRHFYQEAPKDLNSLLLTVHVGLACLAYALFFVASLTSVAYFVQAWRLKQHRPSGLFHKMPPLESLDRSLHLLIVTGYPLFIITVVLGAVWATSGMQEGLSQTWWASPKFVHSVLTAIFFAVAVHARQFGWLHGRRFAYFLFYGFAVVLLSFVGLRLLDLRAYNFWEASL